MLNSECARTLASSIVCGRPHGIEQGEAKDEDEEEEREVEEEEEVTHNATVNELVIIIRCRRRSRGWVRSATAGHAQPTSKPQ